MLAAALLNPLVPSLSGQAADSSSSAPAPGKPSVWPAGRVAVWTGSALVVSALLDHTIRDLAQNNRGATSNVLADAGNHLGTVFQVGPALGVLWWAGKAFDAPRLSDAAGHSFLAVVGAGVLTTGIKYAVGRYRPSQSDSNTRFDLLRMDDSSFPSGHTAVAFALASSLSRETADSWSDVLLYSGAFLTAAARINDNRHWLSDVVGGAAIGYFAGYMATREHRLPVAAVPGGLAVRLSF